jgi:predicted LPLAT superfamily acyltransferase
MAEIFYQWIVLLSKKYGLWVFKTYAWIVATGFYLIFPSGVAAGVRFYRTLFPGKNMWFHLWCVWRQYHHFTSIFLDRFLLEEFDNISYSSEGWEHIEKAIKEKAGGIILMSHMGNWEMAAHMLKRKNPEIPLLLYMGIKQKEQMERLQKESLAGTGVKIIGVEKHNPSPFDIIDGISFLKNGGMVSLTGDRIWHEGQKSVGVRFLGHQLRLPETPYVFSLLSGSPLFVFFAFRTGQGKYHFSITKLDYARPCSRSERKEVVMRSARQYARLLEQAVHNYPFQWGNFGSFPGKRLI